MANGDRATREARALRLDGRSAVGAGAVLNGDHLDLDAGLERLLETVAVLSGNDHDRGTAILGDRRAFMGRPAEATSSEDRALASAHKP